MSLARATISGKVYRAPEKRFTSNNIAVTTLTINIDDDETLIRVKARGNLAESVVSNIKKDDTVVVEGRLITTAVKTEDGAERKVVEIDASAVEKLAADGASTSTSAKSSSGEIVKFADTEFTDELIGEDEIPF